MKKPTIVFIGLLISLGCSNDDDLPNDSIIGKWEWIETVSAWTEIKYTPESEGYTQTSVYRADSIAEFYKNNELISSKSFRVITYEYLAQSSSGSIVTTLEIDNEEIPFTIQNDTLYISSAYTDGPTSFFKRVE